MLIRSFCFFFEVMVGRDLHQNSQGAPDVMTDEVLGDVAQRGVKYSTGDIERS